MVRPDHREDLIDMDSLRTLSTRARDQVASERCDSDITPDEEGSPWADDTSDVGTALSEIPTAGQEEAPAEAQQAARAGNARARRRELRSGHLQSAAEPAAATGPTAQATSAGTRSEAGVAQGDMTSPGEWAATEGGEWPWGGRFERFF